MTPVERAMCEILRDQGAKHDGLEEHSGAGFNYFRTIKQQEKVGESGDLAPSL